MKVEKGVGKKEGRRKRNMMEGKGERKVGRGRREGERRREEKKREGG